MRARGFGVLGVIVLLTAGCGSHSTGRRDGGTTTGSQSARPVRATGQLLVAATSASAVTDPVYVVDVASGRARRLIRAADAFETPQWSPDGRRVLAVATVAGGSDIWSFPVDGGPPTNVERLRGEELQPRWSPDGTRVAFLVQRSGADGDDLYVARVGGAPRRLARDAEAVAWSPDGKIAFSSAGGGIFVVSPHGGQPRRLDRAYADGMVWGPGGRIVYWTVGAMVPHDVYLRARGRVSALGVVGDATFLRNGDLAVSTDEGAEYIRPGGARRYVRLPESPANVTWSSDGRFLAFLGSSSGTVYLARADGSGWKRLRLPFSSPAVLGWRP
jgi:Tol biopolymer transport system component